MRIATRTLVGFGLMAGALLLAARAARAGGDWNDQAIKWVPYSDALATAKKQKKPVCLVFYTEWCPHCQNYSSVFHDPKVVEQTKRFVMVRLDRDKEKDVSKKYSPDGEYIPRTYFLKSDGTLEPEIHAPRDAYKYFYDEHDPASLLGGMSEALAKLH